MLSNIKEEVLKMAMLSHYKELEQQTIGFMPGFGLK
jgi:adenine deaminase